MAAGCVAVVPFCWASCGIHGNTQPSPLESALACCRHSNYCAPKRGTSLSRAPRNSRICRGYDVELPGVVVHADLPRRVVDHNSTWFNN